MEGSHPGVSDDVERTEAAPAQASGETPARIPSAPDGVVKRTSAPSTVDGSRWHVQLSAAPSPAWLEFFKQAADASSSGAATAPRPQRVTFDQASIVFKSEEDHVEQWIGAIDRWIALADTRHIRSLEEASRERSLRLDDEAKKRERIVRLNERFKNL